MDINDYEYKTKSRPHVVILGAGASIASIPFGDKNGKKISVMKGFIKALGLESIIDDVSLNTKSDNLEDIYSEMHEKDCYSEQCIRLEQSIILDFMKYEIPNAVNIYDLLILGLTSKDLIATFNWDPLLLQAYQRVSRITKNLPEMCFLHGNVGVATCEKCKIISCAENLCPDCNGNLTPTKLLFPIKKKNYSDNSFIRNSWAMLQEKLSKAYMVTIFGYSAPKSDKEAVKMLKQVWGDIKNRNYEQFDIIDIREEEDVINSWEDFIHTHHYEYHKSFFESRIALFPRRTCETAFDQFMNNKWVKADKGFKEGQSFVEVKKQLSNLLEDELLKPKMLKNPYI